jgi:hypothetical protein
MAFEFLRYVVRNPSELTRGVRRLRTVRKAMAAFREDPANDQCAWCGRKKRLEVHHIYPVSAYPWLAADPNNMMMLCRKPACHQIIGHNGDFGRRFVENVEDVCRMGASKVVRTLRKK